jgi:hypothetical protein
MSKYSNISSRIEFEIIKVIELDEIYNFVVNPFFIWDRLEFKYII